MAGWSAMTASMNTELKITTAQIALAGGNSNPVGNTLDLRKSQGVGTLVGNTVTGGGDIAFFFEQAVTAGSVVILNLLGMSDYLNRATQSIARIKTAQFRLLSAADDTTITPVPTSTSTCTVTNNPPSTATMAVPNALDFGNGGSGLTLTLTVGATIITSVAISAAGSGYPKSSTFLVSVQQAGGSGGCITVTTNSSGVPTTAVLVAGAGGTGYSNGVVPTVVLGHHFILTGGVQCYFDPNANGFTPVSATNQNIAIVNLDTVNAITVEIGILAATT